MKKRINLVEAARKDTQTGSEKKLQKEIYELLLDDKQGHHYPEFAARFKDFNLVIDKECPTAQIEFDTGEVTVNPGFIEDENNERRTRQLVLLIRHEMAHALLMHQVKTIAYFQKKYPGEHGTKLSCSRSIHSLQNIITDFEISNKRYSDQDKETVKNMTVAGKLIGGLVTEEHRDWAQLNLIEMYERLRQEIIELDNQVLKEWTTNETHTVKDTTWSFEDWKDHVDMIKRDYNMATIFYRNSSSPTNFIGTLDDFLAKKGLYHFTPMDIELNKPCIVNVDGTPPQWVELIKKINDIIPHSTAKRDDVKKMITAIGKTGLTQDFDVYSPDSGEFIANIITPEEKLVAIDALKATLPTLEIYNSWVNKVIKELGDTNKYSRDDVQRILDSLV